jgi:hypothetical protein
VDCDRPKRNYVQLNEDFSLRAFNARYNAGQFRYLAYPRMRRQVHLMDRIARNDSSPPNARCTPATEAYIPAIAERDEVWKFPISGRTYERKTGELP